MVEGVGDCRVRGNQLLLRPINQAIEALRRSALSLPNMTFSKYLDNCEFPS